MLDKAQGSESHSCTPLHPPPATYPPQSCRTPVVLPPAYFLDSLIQPLIFFAHCFTSSYLTQPPLCMLGAEALGQQRPQDKLECIKHQEGADHSGCQLEMPGDR